MSTEIVGHNKQRNNLQKLLNKGRLPTTMMFSGIQGIGKLLVAKELFQTLVCDSNNFSSVADTENGNQSFDYGGCNNCHSCRLFRIGNLPDFHLIECEDKKKWNVNNLRGLLNSLSLKPFSGSFRIVIFNDAEHLTTTAANLLLKALEEPRKGTYYCMITANPSRLPQTLLSRCQIWFFNSLSQHEILEIIEKAPLEKMDQQKLTLEEIAVLADGSMANVESVVLYSDYWKELTSLLSRIYEGETHLTFTLAEKLGKDKDLLRIKLRLMRIFARLQMRSAEQVGAQAKWAICLSNLLTAERLVLDRYFSPAYVLSNLFLNLVSDENLNSFSRYPGSTTLLDNLIA